MKPAILVLDYRIRFRDFKRLQESIDESGPVPKNIDKVIWNLLKEKRIYCWFDPLVKNDMGIGISLPKGRKIKVIKSI